MRNLHDHFCTHKKKSSLVLTVIVYVTDLCKLCYALSDIADGSSVSESVSHSRYVSALSGQMSECVATHGLVYLAPHLQVDGPEVQRVVRHMRMIVQSFHDGSYTVYDGCERAYKSADYAEEHQIFVYDPVPLWKDDIGKDVFDLLQHCGAKYTRPWVAAHSGIWPESAGTDRECDAESETYNPSAMSDGS